MAQIWITRMWNDTAKPFLLLINGYNWDCTKWQVIGELGWTQSLSPSLRNAWGHVKSETWANFNVKFFNFFQVGQNRTPSFIQLKISFGSTEQQQQKPQTIWQDYPVAFIATAAGSASAWSLFCKAASASSIITLSAITEDYHSNWATIVFFSAKLIDN